MTRYMTTGFEESDPIASWSPIYVGGTQTFPYENMFGRDSYITFAPRTGRGMAAVGNFNGQRVYLRKQLPDITRTEMFYGFACRVNILAATNYIFKSYCDDLATFNNYISIQLVNTGAIQVYRGGALLATSGAGVVVVDTWHYYEVWHLPRNVNGRVVVKVDGVTQIDFTGDTTDNREYIIGWDLVGCPSNLSNVFDDFVANDVNGAVNNTYPGVIRLLPIRPHTDGEYGGWARAGVNLGFDAAQARNGTFEFTMLQTPDADDLVTFDTEIPDLPAGATITNVVVTARARVQAGAGVIAPMVRSNGTDSISADQTLNSAWKYHEYAWPVNPDGGGAWSEASLATLEIGASS